MPRQIALIAVLLLVASLVARSGVHATPSTSATESFVTTDSVGIPSEPFPEDAIAFSSHKGLQLGRPRSSQTVSTTPSVTIRNGSPAQLRRLAQALDRFATAGLALPNLEVVFWVDESACGDHLGLFNSATTPWHISICSAVDFVYEHELAHAWEAGSMTNELRSAFMDLRGYTDWSGSDVPGNERGIEGVAFVIQQGLAGLPLPPALGTEAISRLEAFELLTGQPAPRLVEWVEATEIPRDERPTALSRALPDWHGV